MSTFFRSIFNALFPQPTLEKPSPKIRISPGQADSLIKIIQTISGYENCYVAAIAPTNSMEPSIDDGMYVVLDSLPHADLIVGDIIYYEMPEFKAIHSIIEIGQDPAWYCVCKGLNNSAKDPVKVRPYAIKGIWRMTLD